VPETHFFVNYNKLGHQWGHQLFGVGLKNITLL